MTKLAMSLAAVSAFAISGAAFAQTAPSPAPGKTPMTPPASTATPPATTTPAAPMSQPMPPAATPPASEAAPTTPPAAATAPTAPAAPAATVASGMTLKDNTGATVGQITDVKADASGSKMATVKMGEDSFTVAASSLAVQNGSAVINMTLAQLQSQVHKPKS